MNLHNDHADTFVPDDLALPEALARTTRLGIGAHQDDIEIMAFHGVLECYGRRDAWFSSVTCTSGSGSARTGVYADYSDAEMARVRLDEQRHAAMVGRYAAALQLGYGSAEIKDPHNPAPKEDLVQILAATRPQIIYTHNPADKHPTHIGTFGAVLAAIRALPADQRPEQLLGCEVWRDLDWMPDDQKVILNVGGRENLATALVSIFDSQIAGGKRYDLASLGRRRANATYLESHATDDVQEATFAIDLTPLIQDDNLRPADFVAAKIDAFRSAVTTALDKL